MGSSERDGRATRRLRSTGAIRLARVRGNQLKLDGRRGSNAASSTFPDISEHLRRVGPTPPADGHRPDRTRKILRKSGRIWLVRVRHERGLSADQLWQ